MGRKGNGVEIRENSIRLALPLPGRPRETLYLNGTPLDPKPANVKYAIRIAGEIRTHIHNGTFVFAEYFPNSKNVLLSDKPLAKDYLDLWFSLLSGKAQSTLKGYRLSKDVFWKAHLGGQRIDQVRHSDILLAIAATEGKSAKTRNNHLIVIRAVFNLAMRDSLITKDPTVGVENAPYQKPRPDPFSMDEANAIIRYAYEKLGEPVGNYWQFMFFSGLRTGEGFGLHWEQISMGADAVKAVKVDRSMVDGIMKTVKTDQERMVRLNVKSLEALERQKKWSLLADGRVFTDPKSGRPWHDYQSVYKTYWRPTLKRLGIRYRDSYHTRHTYATVGLMSGAKPSFLAKQLGHSQRVFFDKYADWIDSGDNDREMALIEAAIARGLAA